MAELVDALVSGTSAARRGGSSLFWAPLTGQHGHQALQGDLPPGLDFGAAVAIDTETLGLLPRRDKLCVVQLSSGDGSAHLVQLDRSSYEAPNLKALLVNPSVTKIFHFARFDIAVLKHYLNIDVGPVYCTKVASKLVRTYTDRHGLKDLVKELLGIELNKQQQSSDWGAHVLSDAHETICRSGCSLPA